MTRSGPRRDRRDALRIRAPTGGPGGATAGRAAPAWTDALRARSGDWGTRLLLAAAIYVALAVVVLLASPGGEAAAAAVGDLATLPLLLAAAILTLRAARQPTLDRRTRRAWHIVGISHLVYFAGDALWAYYDLILGEPLFPSLADVAYLAYYPVLLVGLLCFPFAPAPAAHRAKLLLDAAISLLSGAMIVWYLVMLPTVQAGSADSLTMLLSLGYPVGDVLLLAGVAAVASRRPLSASLGALRLLIGGLLLMFAADLMFGALSLQEAYVPGGPVDALWILAVFGMVGAGQYQFVRATTATVGAIRRPDETAAGWMLPPVMLVVGLSVLGYAALRRGPDDPMTGLVVASIALFGSVAVRQVATERESAGLHAAAAAGRVERRYRALVQNARDLIVIVDGAGIVRYASPSVEAVLGREGVPTVGSPFANAIHPDDAAGIEVALGAIRDAPDASGLVEFRLARAHDGWRYFEAICRNLLDDPSVGGIVVTAHDITDHKSVERALADQYRAVVDGVAEVIFTTDLELRWTFLNPAWTEITGYEVAASLGTGVRDVIHPDDVEPVLGTISALLAGRESVASIGGRLLTKAGLARWVEAEARLVVGRDGQPAGLSGTLRDVTERHETELALQAAMAEAERANRAKSEFLSRMSHELRTPMNSILGFSELLRLAELPPSERECVDHISVAGRHLLELINEVLDIARIETERMSFALEPVPLGPVLRESLELVAPLAAGYGIAIGELPDAGCGTVIADRQRFAQVLLNLLSNAVKYNRPAGRVTIGCVPAGPDRLRVTIGDTGAGIAPEALDRLFVPFDRLGAERGPVEGTGLGLAVSRGLVEGMGGTIGVESTPGEGSVFWVEFPLAEPSRTTAPSEPSESPSGAGPASSADAAPEVGGGPAPGAPGESGSSGRAQPWRVLSIEDDPANAALIRRILARRNDIRVIEADSGRSGLAAVAERRPDLILLDLHLPDIEGDEILRRLHDDPAQRGVPVVVLSADATPSLRDRLIEAGATEFLTKPLDVAEFVRLIDASCTQGRVEL